ncbi:MAG: RluA family pseudouridine synthase [Eubacterium sp.]|nr:RluA family pseudouridine synthase [Eubacterium sp.]
MREVEINEAEAGQRLDKFLQRYLPGAATGFLYKMLRKKNITVNDHKSEGGYILREHDCIRIFFSEETFLSFRRTVNKMHTEGTSAFCHSAASVSEKDSISDILSSDEIIYEDPHILLANKPAGLLSQKAEEQDVSLVEQVRRYLLQSGKRTEEDFYLYRPGTANRLDRNTSGLVAVPLDLPSARILGDFFRNRTIRKVYLCLVGGNFEKKQLLEGWHSRDTRSNKTSVTRYYREGSKKVSLVCTPVCYNNGVTLLSVDLLTGKTHQIRSQLAEYGYAIVGDPKYGTMKGVQSDCRLKRQFLHAYEMHFPICPDPLSALSERSFFAPLPEELKKTAERFGIVLPQANYRGRQG